MENEDIEILDRAEELAALERDDWLGKLAAAAFAFDIPAMAEESR